MRIRASLPAGVDALFFETARLRRELERRLSQLLDDAGYGEVLLPILDYFDPYGPLLDPAETDRLYRFVDRDGQLLALRGDFTPMLARLLAPRLEALGLPQRLYYRGDVIRYGETGPGSPRESAELGAELLTYADGSPDHDADLELLRLFLQLITAVLPAAGPRKPSALLVVVGWAGAFDELLRRADQPQELLRAIARRDREALRRIDPGLLHLLEEGRPSDPEILGTETALALERLDQALAVLREENGEDAVELRVDLPELAPAAGDNGGTLSHRYYDGFIFRAYVPGAAHPLGRGGRYNRLFQSLGAAAGAIGFSLGLDQLLDVSIASPPGSADAGTTRREIST